ncbi:MAG: tsaB [Alphaproteobacteria bacterium]|nr:tsaB [Alphaproteobacteria bacterium]
MVVDTSSAACSVALIDGDKVIDRRHAVVGRGHAEHLLPMVESLLAGRRPDSILVDCGPGSFTGIRVGLAAAHGLAIGWGIEVSGYSSTALVAAASGAREVTVALQGGHGELFVQSFRNDPLAATDALRSLPPAEAAASAQAELVAGSGAEALVKARGHGRALDTLPDAADARLLPPALRSLPARPIYGRAPDARPMA